MMKALLTADTFRVRRVRVVNPSWSAIGCRAAAVCVRVRCVCVYGGETERGGGFGVGNGVVSVPTLVREERLDRGGGPCVRRAPQCVHMCVCDVRQRLRNASASAALA